MKQAANSMKFLLFVSVLSFALALASAHDSHVFSLPFFIWSNESELRFKGGKSEVFTTTEAEEVETLLEELINGVSEDSQLTNRLANHAQASTMVIFVSSQMRTDLFSRLASAFGKANGGSFKKLKTILDGSPSSLTLPYVKLDEPFSATLESTFSIASDKVVVKIALPASSMGSHSFQKRFGSKVSYLTHELLLAELNQYKAGEKRTVYVVGFDEELPQESELKNFFAKQDEFIGSVDALLQLSAQKYVGMFSAERAFTNDWKMETARATNVDDYITFKYLEAIDEFESTTNNNKTQLYDDHWPPAVWEGMMVSLMLILIVLIGLSCTCDIQVPKMFISPSAALTKKQQ